MQTKVLVTAGCSFSECVNWYEQGNADNRTWPVWLAEKLSVPHYAEGLGSQGNGMISRRAMYRIEQLLAQHAPEDLLVGIMWSGRDRFEFYFQNPAKFPSNIDNWMQNPCSFVDGDPGGWVIVNPHWKHEHNAPWYRYYYNELASQIYTLEHVLNLQRYLELKNIRYFMSTNTGATFNKESQHNPNIQWMWDQINWDMFLPIIGEYEWVNSTCAIPDVGNFHPRSEQHERFVNDVIWPWLEEKKLI